MTTQNIGPGFVDAALGSEAMDDVARYSGEGRRFQRTDLSKLNDRFLELYRGLFEPEAVGSDASKEFQDISSELTLRGEKMPTPSPEDQEHAVRKLQELGKEIEASPEASDGLARTLVGKLPTTKN